jgi:hypothetical protein
MRKTAYLTHLPFDPITEGEEAQATSPFPVDAHGRPMTMLQAYYQARPLNPLLPMPAFEPSDAYWHTMLLRAQLRQQHQGLGELMRPIDLYRVKRATEEAHRYDDRIDPILLHPLLSARPKTLDELGDRRQEYNIGLGAGGTIGALGGAALGMMARKFYPKGPALIPAAGALTGAATGAGLALWPTTIKRFMSNVDRHDRAVKDFEDMTGKELSFTTRHPYLTDAGAAIGGGLAGMAIGAAVGGMTGHGAVRGAFMGNIGGSIMGPLLSMGAQAGRKDEVGPYIDPKRLRGYGYTLWDHYED